MVWLYQLMEANIWVVENFDIFILGFIIYGNRCSSEYTIVFALLRVSGLGEEYDLDVCSGRIPYKPFSNYLIIRYTQQLPQLRTLSIRKTNPQTPHHDKITSSTRFSIQRALHH